MRKIIASAVVAVIAAFALSACEMEGSGQQAEDETRQSNYDKLVKSQPAHSMEYSPTRDTKNFWIDTWKQKGKLSYVYLMNGNGEVFGYFILQGLPVSYCTSLVVPYQILSDSDGKVAVPGPSVDGTYSSGANCSEYYGKDAVTGAYVEYSVGMGINALVFDSPLPQYGDAKPMGNATIAKVEGK